MLTKSILSLSFALILVGCNAGDSEDEQLQVESSPPASGTVVVSENEEPTEESDRYFDLDALGGRYTVIGESSADLGLGFRSILIMLNDERFVNSARQRENMYRILIETARDKFQMFLMGSAPLTDGTLPLILDANDRIVAELTPTLGEWNGYFFVADHNQNGVDEIIILRLGGNTYAPEFWEYRNGELVLVLDPYDHAARVVAMEAPEPRTVIIYDVAFDRSELPYLRQVFQWNDETKRYEHISAEPVNEFPE
jgi:hypothetical protein